MRDSSRPGSGDTPTPPPNDDRGGRSDRRTPPDIGRGGDRTQERSWRPGGTRPPAPLQAPSSWRNPRPPAPKDNPGARLEPTSADSRTAEITGLRERAAADRKEIARLEAEEGTDRNPADASGPGAPDDPGPPAPPDHPEPYEPDKPDAANAEIADLRKQLADSQAKLDAANTKIGELESQIETIKAKAGPPGDQGDQARGGRPEITGLHLREGFDAEDAAWLKDFRSTHADLPEPPAGRVGSAEKPEAPGLRDRIADAAKDAPQHAEDLPPGGELSRRDDPEKSRLERLGNKFYRAEIQEDLASSANEIGNAVEGAFRRPPTGVHIVKPTDTAVWKSPDAHQGIDGGSVMTAVLATSLVVGRAIKYGHAKFTDLKEKHAGDG